MALLRGADASVDWEAHQERLEGMAVGIAIMLVLFARVSSLSVPNFHFLLYVLRLFSIGASFCFLSIVGYTVYSVTKTVNSRLGCHFYEFIVCNECHRCWHKSQIRHKSQGCTCAGHPKLYELREGRYYPKRAFYYQYVKERLQEMFLRDSFRDSINHFRNRKQKRVMTDLYDGKVWKRLCSPGGLLHSHDNLAFIINYDNYNPFNKQMYSMGAIYLTIANLPRKLRYKRENMVLVGLIYGPTEVKGSINSYIAPLVEELRELERGVTVTMADGTQKAIRATILAFCCDVPGLRKLVQWGGHSSNFGCHLCMKRARIVCDNSEVDSDKSEESESCEESENNADSSESEKDGEEEKPKKRRRAKRRPRTWAGTEINTPRTNDESRAQARAWRDARTKAQKNRLFQSNGVKYYPFFDLAGFDIVESSVIDQMHQLFLGVSKHCLRLVMSTYISSKALASKIDKRIDFVAKFLPSYMPSIPSPFSEKFHLMKADQIRVFVFVYSTAVFYDTLPSDVFFCWANMVAALSMFSARTVSESLISLGGQTYLEFLVMFTEIFGEKNVPINFHLVTHIPDMLRNFGPMTGWACCVFERLNKMSKAIQTNKKNIEKQYMRDWVLRQCVADVSAGSERSEWSSRLPKHILILLRLLLKEKTFGACYSYCLGRPHFDEETQRRVVLGKSSRKNKWRPSDSEYDCMCLCFQDRFHTDEKKPGRVLSTVSRITLDGRSIMSCEWRKNSRRVVRGVCLKTVDDDGSTLYSFGTIERFVYMDVIVDGVTKYDVLIYYDELSKATHAQSQSFAHLPVQVFPRKGGVKVFCWVSAIVCPVLFVPLPDGAFLYVVYLQ